ncbi:MAG: hypothetical protein H7X83_07115 [Verrucomicrobia bacterium]|nr:hypothetical protein [Deltaproteobacteria bacterium]
MKTKMEPGRPDTNKRRIDLKGNEKVIEHLNLRLAEELTAINQYHIDEIESQLNQLKQIGPQNYLVEQIH